MPALRAQDNQIYYVKNILTIGRDRTCQIYLTDPRVSRLHALIIEKEGFLYVRDDGSSNGTFVNGIRIRRSTLLQMGDTLGVGDTKFTVEYDQDQSPFLEETHSVLSQPYSIITDHPQKKEETQLASTLHKEDPTDITLLGPISSQTKSERSVLENALQKNEYTNQLRWYIGLGGVISLIIIGLSIFLFISMIPKTPSVSLHQTDQPQFGDPIAEYINLQGGEIDSIFGAKLIIPSGAVKNDSMFGIAHHLKAPTLPLPLLAQSLPYIIETSSVEPLSTPVEVVIPLSVSIGKQENVNKNNLAVFGWVEERWTFMGGIQKTDGIHIYTDQFTTFQVITILQNDRWSENRPLLIFNEGGIRLIVRPWYWWFPLDNKLVQEDLSHAIAFIDLKPEEGNNNRHQINPFGYLSLPYGSYSAWCVSWLSDEHGQMVNKIIKNPLALTQYSCTWEAYLKEDCPIEKISFQITVKEQGNSNYCASSETAP